MNQCDWLIELVKEVIVKEGFGVIYWEFFWVFIICFMQWGQGFYQEYVIFFDFDINLLFFGGIEWMEYDYGLIFDMEQVLEERVIDFDIRSDGSVCVINKFGKLGWNYNIVDSLGRVVEQGKLGNGGMDVNFFNELFGYYILMVGQGRKVYIVFFINLK